MAQADSRIDTSEEVVPAENLTQSFTAEAVVPAESLTQSTTAEVVVPAESVTQSTTTEMVIPYESLTHSTTTETIKKTRKTIHWICMFQLMEPLPGMIPKSIINKSVFIDNKFAVREVDTFLKDAFELFYNKDTSTGKDRRNLILCVLGGKYVWHPASKIIAGVLVLYTRLHAATPSLNAHLRLEKMEPLEAPSCEKYHKLYFGDCYPIHTEDVVCIQGNSLRALLRNWVNDEFFESLHWIIPPSYIERYNSYSMDNIQTLLKKMKKAVQESPRKKIRRDKTPAVAMTSAPGEKRKRDQDMSGHHKIWEFVEVEPGKTYKVKANHWANEDDDLPLDSDGFPDMEKYRFVVYIKDRGGIVQQISTRKCSGEIQNADEA